MEAAKKLQAYFIGLQREDQPTNEETLRKVCFFCQILHFRITSLLSYCRLSELVHGSACYGIAVVLGVWE